MTLRTRDVTTSESFRVRHNANDHINIMNGVTRSTDETVRWISWPEPALRGHIDPVSRPREVIALSSGSIPEVAAVLVVTEQQSVAEVENSEYRFFDSNSSIRDAELSD